jgi:hypothetical protein
VILAKPDVAPITIQAAPGESLNFMSFYLPSFLD